MYTMTKKHGVLPELNLTSTGDMEQIDLCEEDDISEYSCPLLSSDNEPGRATTLTQELFEKQPQTLAYGGDQDAESNKTTWCFTDCDFLKLFDLHLTGFNKALLLAFLFRMALLLFATWQDQTRWPDGQLRFTDVDYDVFTDAARALVAGKDIYEARPTYRYSPLIAAVLAPGHWLFGSQIPESSTEVLDDIDSEDHVEMEPLLLAGENQALARIWGKLVFVMSDLLCAWLQFQIILTESELHNSEKSDSPQKISQWTSWFIILGWLFNPVTAVVSVRGNAEAFLGVFVLLCLLLLLKQHILCAGLVFGLCIHLKFYPVIYAPAIYLWLSYPPHHPTSATDSHPILALLPSRKHFIFGLGTISSLGLLTAWGYVWFGGMQFLWQAYLYHIGRVDIKHNFAPHFYPLYLLTGSKWKMDQWTNLGHSSHATDSLFTRLQSSLVGYSNITEPGTFWDWILALTMRNVDLWNRLFNVVCFLPAVLLIPKISFTLFRQLGLCWFVTTYVFVTFNKVCTSQYFLWSLFLFPIALASIQLPSGFSPVHVIAECLLLWFGAQALWLASAYTLEMRNQSSDVEAAFVWRLVWFASLVFLATNVVLIRRFIKWRKPCDCSAETTDSYDSYITQEKKAQ